MAVDTVLRERVAEVRERVTRAAVDAGRDPVGVTIVAVSKTFPRADVDEAIRAGLTVFGENRVQEAREKFAAPLPSGIKLHLIGHLQSNKARHACQLFDCIESVDRASLIERLDHESAKLGKRLPVFLQVNIAREPQKTGCAPEEAETLARQLEGSSHLSLDGLMTIAPLVSDPEETRPVFRALRELRDRLRADLGLESLQALSMGMTNDYPVAIAEGATHIRLGRALFGSR
jgi:pyridoxal phosphate enzyme (YggS family)